MPVPDGTSGVMENVIHRCVIHFTLIYHFFVSGFRMPDYIVSVIETHVTHSLSCGHYLLVLGYRMPAPDGMPNDIEKVMDSCWEATPSDRPKFEDLHKRLLSIKKTI